MLPQTKKKSSSIIHWLLNNIEPNAYAIPSIKLIDKLVILVPRLSYIFLRILFRIVLGKKRREKLQFYRKLKCENPSISFSFYFFMNLYRFIRFLKIGNPILVKLDVPKYKYKIYCPSTEEDFILMTEREDNILKYFQPNKGDVVIDVGAHLGRYAFISANRIGKKEGGGKVIAIEAYPQVYQQLNKNIRLNRFDNILTLNCAAFSKKDKIKLFVREESTLTVYSPHNTVMVGRNELSPYISKTRRSVEIEANTLDNIVNLLEISYSKITWIKIDVEGAELEVLKGAHNILSSKDKGLNILIEVHHLQENKNQYEDVMAILKKYNFKLKYERIHDNGERHIIVTK